MTAVTAGMLGLWVTEEERSKVWFGPCRLDRETAKSSEASDTSFGSSRKRTLLLENFDVSLPIFSDQPSPLLLLWPRLLANFF